MILDKVQIIKFVSALGLLLAVLVGCTARGIVKSESVNTVLPGSVADVHFTCSLQNGEVAAATDKAVGEDTDVHKSSVFVPRGKDGPISLKAVANLVLPAQPAGKELAFEDEIINRLFGLLIGMKEGESRMVELKAQDVPERQKEDYVIRIARVRVRAKEMRMTVAEYLSRTGKSPEEGQPFVFDPVIPGQVKSVTQDEVVILFSAKPGEVVQTPFGPGRIRETEQNYEIEIAASEGALVRSGPLVGCISGVDDKYITIDYRNPFGGETLLCGVTVEKVSDVKPASGGAGK